MFLGAQGLRIGIWICDGPGKRFDDPGNVEVLERGSDRSWDDLRIGNGEPDSSWTEMFLLAGLL
ncbi:MAG: hypothetical protein JWM16_2509 [Verrucomicrobiales bacterium]|nr:hypothetical protein [Verrucomicrobiales bacterium]